MSARGWPPLPGTVPCCATRRRWRSALSPGRTWRPLWCGMPGWKLLWWGRCIPKIWGSSALSRMSWPTPTCVLSVRVGPDSSKSVGHYPGQSLVALAQHGINDRGRITGALGRRPILKNLSPEAVAHFREVVEVIDLIGETDVLQVLSESKRCAARNQGGPKPYGVSHTAPGYLPARMEGDPAGSSWFVDRTRGILSLEHYRNDGLLEIVIGG